MVVYRHLRSQPMLSLLATAVLLAATACGPDPDSGTEQDDPPNTPAATNDESEPTSPAADNDDADDANDTDEPAEPSVADTIATDLTTPWGLAFLPDNEGVLVTERDTGEIKLVGSAGEVETVGSIPDVVPSSEGGLLGIAVSPTFADDAYVYAYFSTARDNRIARMRYENGSLGSPDVIVDGIPAAAIHNGGRLAFGPDDMLYVSTGDANDQSTAQDPDSLAGKILRLTPDGDAAPGNPTDGSPIWSLGHRNVQGLAWDDDDRLWASEFGADSWDELNLIEPGANYGWPEFEGPGGEPDYVDPVEWWETSDASPSGIAYARGAVWMAALQGEQLWRIQTDGAEADGDPQGFFGGDYGRLRTVKTAPDGALWLITSNTDGRGSVADDDDRILRLELN